MTYNASYGHLNNTDTLYALPESEDVGSTTGLIAGVYNAGAVEPNTYDFTGLDDGVNYYVYVQVDASPSVSDFQDGLIVTESDSGDASLAKQNEILAAISGLSGSGGGQYPVVILTPEQAASATGSKISIIQGDDYTGSRSLPIEVETEADLSGQYAIVAVSRNNTSGQSFRGVIYESDGKQFFDLSMTKEQTSKFSIGDWSYIVRLESAIDAESQISKGTWHVSGFTSPSPIQGTPRV